MFESLAKIIQFDVTPDHGDFFGRRISHDICEEAEGFSQCPLRRLKPHHARGHAQEISVAGKRPHDLSGFFLTAASFGRCSGSVALIAATRSRRTSAESSDNARSSW